MKLIRIIILKDFEHSRFIIKLQNDEVEWLEDFDKEDQKELEEEAENLI